MGGNGTTNWYTMQNNKGRAIERLTSTQAKIKATQDGDFEQLYRYPVTQQNGCTTEEFMKTIGQGVTITTKNARTGA